MHDAFIVCEFGLRKPELGLRKPELGLLEASHKLGSDLLSPVLEAHLICEWRDAAAVVLDELLIGVGERTDQLVRYQSRATELSSSEGGLKVSSAAPS